MDEHKTELVFVIDKSGSMSGLESDTIGGFDAMVHKQQQVPGVALTTVVLFDAEVTVLHHRLDVRSVGALSEEDYVPGGSTALLDAIGLAIDKIVNVQRHTAESLQAGYVVFVIITDALENASKRYTIERIKL